jgi:ribose/xylose/arabinose/galactoside ABC-type transport system permease subunit
VQDDEIAVVATKAPAVRGREFLRRLLTLIGPFAGLIGTTLLFAYLTRHTGRFLTVYTWRMIAVHTVIVGTAALGMTIVMIGGGIDLTVGSVVALVTVVLARLIKDVGLPMPVALVCGVAAGGLCGLLNGALITGLRVTPFIITLGGMTVYRGLAKWLSGSTTIYIAGSSKPWWFSRLLAPEPTPSWLVVAPGVWMLLGLCVTLAGVLRYSVLGRYFYAVGSNEATARLCGVNVPAVKLSIYGLAGLATGLAGVLQFAFLTGTGDPTTAVGMELEVIAAVVIGGASLSGGEGTVLGTLIGCLFMSVLKSGCVHADISPASQDVIIGAIIVAAVTLDQVRRRGRAALA